MSTDRKTEVILGLPVDQLSYEEILSDLPIYKTAGKQMRLTSVNPQILLHASKYPEVCEYVKKSTHRLPDGIGVVLVSKLTTGTITDRITGYDLMLQLLAYADRHHNRIFLYGAHPDVLKKTVEQISRDYPRIEIVGHIDGYHEAGEAEVVEQINLAHPDFLFVALGFPKQELFLSRNWEKLTVPVIEDVGGSFDVIGGAVKRAPDFFIKSHLEWAYRSFSSPKRFKRAFELPVFLVKALWVHFFRFLKDKGARDSE